MGREGMDKGWNNALHALNLGGWMDGRMKKAVNERASGLSLFSMCLLLGKLDASEKVIVIGIVATVEIPEWEAFRVQYFPEYSIDAKLR